MNTKPSQWRCSTYTIALNRPRIMGVVNVTPDSFSDGGKHNSTDAAIEHAIRLLDEGADIIDVGGESTRPGFTAVSPEEEARRVAPVVEALAQRGVVVSIDTRHPEVAELCVNLGASIINDVEGFSNPDMVKVAAQCNAGCIVMHSGSCSKKKHKANHSNENKLQDNQDELNAIMSESHYNVSCIRDEIEIVDSVKEYLFERANMLERAGVSRDRICIDPGAGFGKNSYEDFILHQSFCELSSLEYPLMCAISRKRMTGALMGPTSPDARDGMTAGMCLGAIEQGARIIRVHNVKLNREVIDGYWLTTHPASRRAFIALGSNVGDRIGYLEEALNRIQQLPLTRVQSVSHAYDTEPAYGIETTVVDAVAQIETQLPPLALLKHLQKIELDLGRHRTDVQAHCEPRTIDLDLLWMDDEIHAGNLLELPHPRMGERDFVLHPLEDLVPNAEQMLEDAGINVVSPELRLGKVTSDLGALSY